MTKEQGMKVMKGETVDEIEETFGKNNNEDLNPNIFSQLLGGE